MRHDFPGNVIFIATWLVLSALIGSSTPTDILTALLVGGLLAMVCCLPIAYLLGLTVNLAGSLSSALAERRAGGQHDKPAILDR